MSKSRKSAKAATAPGQTIDMSRIQNRAKAEGERGKLAGKLGNPGFRAKAEAEVIAETEERLAEAEAELARLDAALSRIAS